MGRYSAHLISGSDCQDVLATISPGVPVKLTPEPDNPDDPRAIKAITRDGQKVGNVERESWLTKAILDDQLPVASRVHEILGGTPETPLRMVVLEVLTGPEATEALTKTTATTAAEHRTFPTQPAEGAQAPLGVRTLEGTGMVVATVIAVVLFVFALACVGASKEHQDPSLFAVGFVFLLPGVVLYPPLASVMKRRFGIPRDTGMHIAFTAVGAGIGLVIAVATIVAQEKAHPEIAAKREADRKSKETVAKALAGAGEANPSTQIPRGLGRNEMLAEARAALRKNAPDRGLAIVFDNAPAELLREDAEVKSLVAELEARLKTMDAPAAAGDFAEKVRTYWLPEIASIPTTAPGSAGEIWNTTSKLEDLARSLEDGGKLPLDPAGKQAYASMRNALAAKQRVLFPVLRSGFAKTVGQTLWESEIDIRTVGAGNRGVIWSGGPFAARANIARAHEGAAPNLLKLRFTTSTYEWVRGVGQTYRYDLTPPSDGAVGYWDGGTFKAVN